MKKRFFPSERTKRRRIIARGTRQLMEGMKKKEQQEAKMKKLVEYVERKMKDALLSFVDFSMAEFTHFLDQKGMYFEVVCDKTNNSPEDIEQGKINIDVVPYPVTFLSITIKVED